MPAGVSAWTPLANTTLASAANSVTFSGISGAYRDLMLVIQGSTTGPANVRMRFNGDTGSNYTFVFLAGASGKSSEWNWHTLDRMLCQLLRQLGYISGKHYFPYFGLCRQPINIKPCHSARQCRYYLDRSNCGSLDFNQRNNFDHG
jgi:hypothetical protein